ncbi:oligosaccharide flippase family protein, partial [Vibrio metoecus]
LVIFLRMEDNNNFNILKFNPCIAKNLFKEAIPLMASSILFPLFMQADILLISFIMSENEVGIYSAASRLITQFLFVGGIVTMTFYLGISSRINEKSLDEEKYIQGVLAMILVIAIIMSSSVFIFSEHIVNILYGDKFNGSEKILEVLSWEWLLILPAA